MFLGAILWPNIEYVHYGCHIIDTEEIGFRDSKFYNLAKEDKNKFIKELDRDECKILYKNYMKIEKNIIRDYKIDILRRNCV